jgi:hypothetical protein
MIEVYPYSVSIIKKVSTITEFNHQDSRGNKDTYYEIKLNMYIKIDRKYFSR